jgi:hypothetical protein
LHLKKEYDKIALNKSILIMNILKKIIKKKKSIILSEEQIKQNTIEHRVDLLIENQNFAFLSEVIQNGYELTEDQCKKLFFSVLCYGKTEATLRIDFDIDEWLNGIEKIKPYSPDFFNKCLHYMGVLLKDYYDGPTELSPSYAPKLLKPWIWGNVIKEHNVCAKFVERFYTEFASFHSTSSIEEMKKSINKLYNKYDEEEELTLLLSKFHKLLTNMINEKLNHEMNEELFLKQIKAIYTKKETLLNTQEKFIIPLPLTLNENNVKESPQSELSNIQNIIKTINVNNLDDIQKLEFNNLTQQQLPQILKNYQEIDENYRNHLIQGESANSILEQSLEQLKALLVRLKEAETENVLSSQISKLKTNHEYLKAKA